MPVCSLSLSRSRSPSLLAYPPHATKTIEQTVIGQFEFMYTRRSHERFVRPSRLGPPQNTCTFTCIAFTPSFRFAPLFPRPHTHSHTCICTCICICVFILCLCCCCCCCSVGLHGQPCQMLRVMARKCCCRKRIRNLILLPLLLLLSPQPDNNSSSVGRGSN